MARVTVAAAGAETGAPVVFDPTDADTTTNSYQADLEEGRNIIGITATSMYGMASWEYKLTVFRTPAVADTSGFLQVDAGQTNYCGLRVDHTITCQRSSSYLIFLNHSTLQGIFEQVSVKWFKGCALKSGGSQQCWDSGGKYRPRTGLKVGDYSMSAEYGSHVCVLKENGNIWCQEGFDDPDPRTVEGPFKAVAQMRRGVCGIRSDGTVRCWRYFMPRCCAVQFGPMDIPGELLDTEFKFIGSGYGTVCGILKSDSTVLCWEWDVNAQRGYHINGGQRIWYLPDNHQYSFVDASAAQFCGVRVDGTIECWERQGETPVSLSGCPMLSVNPASVTNQSPWKAQ